MLGTLIGICFWNEIGDRNFDPGANEGLCCTTSASTVFFDIKCFCLESRKRRWIDTLKKVIRFLSQKVHQNSSLPK